MDKKKEIQRHQEDAALIKALYWLGGAAILEFLMILVNRYYINYTTTVESVQFAKTMYFILSGVRIAGIVVSIAVLLFLFLHLKNGKQLTHWHIGALAISAVATLCGHFSLVFGSAGVQMLLLLIPALGGLALVFFLYQRDFFFSAAITGMAGVVVWSVRLMSDLTASTVYIGVVKTLFGAALLLYIAKTAQKHGGQLLYKGRSFPIFTKDTVYNAMYLSTLVSTISVIVAVVLGSGFAFYLLYTLIAWIFALLVFYTVRML